MTTACASRSFLGAAARLARVLAAIAVLVASVAAAPQVAELTVIAYGAQRLDLATGFTELLDGGEVIDQGSGVRLSAPWLRYAEGEELEARDATVDGPFGVLSAPTVTVDLRSGSLQASGGVVLEQTDGQTLRADTIAYDGAEGWATARGGVVGESPPFTAEMVLAHVETGRFVLVAPYAYQDGPVRLSSDSPEARLQLTPTRDADGLVDGYDAATTLDEDVHRRLGAGVE